MPTEISGTSGNRVDGLLSSFRAKLRRSSPEQISVVKSRVEAPAELGTLVREGNLVRLRQHMPSNRDAFQRWYADPEIAHLLRHDLTPLTERQSRGYFDTIILPASKNGTCFAIHLCENDALIGTTAITDAGPRFPRSGLFRIVIGEKWAWNHGYGTDATRLVIAEAFEKMDLDEVQLEVFQHNPRAIAAYTRVGFHRTGEHTEYVPPDGRSLHVIEMSIQETDWTTDHANHS